MKKVICFLFLWSFLSPSFADAYLPQEGNITATVGTWLTKTHFNDPGTKAKPPWLGGFGLIALGDINERGSLEIGLAHQNKIYFRERGGRYLSEGTELMNVTMGYRRWWNPYFSSALLFSSAYTMGNPRTVYSDFTPQDDVDTSARDTTEYAVEFSTQGDLKTWDNVALILDLRYALSLTNKPNEKADHYGFMLGLRYLVQEKIPAVSPPGGPPKP